MFAREGGGEGAGGHELRQVGAGPGDVAAGVVAAARGGGAGGVVLVIASSRFPSFAIPHAVPPLLLPLLSHPTHRTSSPFRSFTAAAWVTWPSRFFVLRHAASRPPSSVSMLVSKE